MNSSVIKVRLIDPQSNTDQVDDIHISDGRIVAIGEAPTGFSADKTIEGKGLLACPGLIDTYARLREPGYETKADISSETFAALHNGITSVICSPDTDPVIDEVATVELISQRASNAGFARVLPLAAMTSGLDGEHLSEIATLTAAGCVGASNADIPVNNTLVIRRVMEYARTFNIVLVFAPVDSWLAGTGCAHEGSWATRLGLPAIPVAAETVALGMLLELASETEARIHFSRITSARGAEMIRQAKARGMPVTADTSINHLFLTEATLEHFNSLYKSVAPFRSVEDRQGLIKAVIDGTLDAVCSDHSPLEADAKLAPFPSAESGLSVFDTYFQLLLKFGQDNDLSMIHTLRVATSGPAKVFGLNSGVLMEGAIADLILFDEMQSSEVTAESLLSRGKNTPYMGVDFKGRVKYAALEGNWHEL